VTIVVTESDPEAVAAFADRMVVLARPDPSAAQAAGLQGGRIALEGTPRDLFAQVERLAALGVAVPQLAQVAALLNERMAASFEFLTVEEAREALAVHLG
jgi:hypothetical protein